MMKRIIIGILLLFSACVYGQNSGLYWNNLSEKSNRLQGKLMGVSYYITAESNSYFFLQDDWVTGGVTLNDGDKFENLRFRYNHRYDELILFNKNRNTLFSVDKEIVQSFSYQVNGKEVLFLNLPYKSFNKTSRYFRELYSGKNKLLAYHTLRELKVSPYLDRNQIMRDTEFRPHQDYFLYSAKGKYSKVQPKRKSLTHLLPEHKKEIRKLLRKNKLTVLDEPTLIKAVTLLEQEGLLN